MALSLQLLLCPAAQAQPKAYTQQEKRATTFGLQAAAFTFFGNWVIVGHAVPKYAYAMQYPPPCDLPASQTT